MRNLWNRKTILKVLLCIICLGVIFYNGTRRGEISQRSSNEFIKVVSKFMNIPLSTFDKANIKFNDVNFYVRKNAHFFQYLILSVLMCSAVKQLKLYKWSEIYLLLFLLLLFPVADEFIQKFIPGRTSNIFDVVIDFSGGIIGMLIFNIRYKVHKKKATIQF
ncbi:MAG TPA: VanZ family protein [Clostridium sp.]|uniref:VanZ family protein n=1 Tax=Clostridium sp. TaxID=1506 RepID=UPI002F9241C3